MGRPKNQVVELRDYADLIGPLSRLVYISRRIRLEAAQEDVGSILSSESALPEEIRLKVRELETALAHSERAYQALEQACRGEIERILERAEALGARKAFAYLETADAVSSNG